MQPHWESSRVYIRIQTAQGSNIRFSCVMLGKISLKHQFFQVKIRILVVSTLMGYFDNHNAEAKMIKNSREGILSQMPQKKNLKENTGEIFKYFRRVKLDKFEKQSYIWQIGIPQ